MFMYIFSLLKFPPTLLSHPSWSSQNTELSSLCYTAASHQLFYKWQCMYVNPYVPSHPPSLPHVHMSIDTSVCLFLTCICICICDTFQIPHVCINIQYLFFSFQQLSKNALQILLSLCLKALTVFLFPQNKIHTLITASLHGLFLECLSGILLYQSPP